MAEEKQDWLAVCQHTCELMAAMADDAALVARNIEFMSKGSSASFVLRDMERMLKEQAGVLRKATGDKLREEYQAMQAHSGDILNACLAMSELTRASVPVAGGE